MKIEASKIIEATGIHPLKVRNIYQYGSRVYENHRTDSDFDIIMIASHMLAHEEKREKIDGELFNIHIHTPDRFQESLKRHDMMNLECYYAPESAIIQEKINLELVLDKKKLCKNLLSASFNSWRGAKMKINDCDIYRGTKGVFHALRILMFAIQIAEHDKIIDFSEANDLWFELDECNEVEWFYFKDEYLPKKIELENKLKTLTH